MNTANTVPEKVLGSREEFLLGREGGMSFGLKREREKRRNPVGREDKRIFSGLFCNILF